MTDVESSFDLFFPLLILNSTYKIEHRGMNPLEFPIKKNGRLEMTELSSLPKLICNLQWLYLLHDRSFLVPAGLAGINRPKVK